MVRVSERDSDVAHVTDDRRYIRPNLSMTRYITSRADHVTSHRLLAFVPHPSLMARGRGAFGLTSSRGGGGRGGFRGGWRGRWRGRGGSRGGKSDGPAPKREDDGTQLAERFERTALNDDIDEKLGFGRILEGGRKEGWLVNMHPVSFALILDA